MAEKPEAPAIAPAVTRVMGETVEVVADAAPDVFPNGLELVVFQPGALEPIGKIYVPVGKMIALVPLGMSAAMRPQIRATIAQAQAAAQAQGKVRAPGVVQ